MWNEDNIVQDEEFAELLRHIKPLLGDPKSNRVDFKTPHLDAHKAAQTARAAQPPQTAKKLKKDSNPSSDNGRPKKAPVYSKKIWAILYKNKDLHKFYIAPDIDPHKEANALASCNIPEQEKLLGLLDLTVFGKADDCMAFTNQNFYHKNYDGEVFKMSYSDLARVEIKTANDSMFLKDLLIGKQTLSLGGISFSVDRITRILTLIKAVMKRA
jgi:hypothetical protein